MDKIAKAAMSREMLAAGLTAAAAAIAASPKARKAIREAGLDAADSASAAATQMMSNASKLGFADCRSGCRRSAARAVWKVGRRRYDFHRHFFIEASRQARRAAENWCDAQGASHQGSDRQVQHAQIHRAQDGRAEASFERVCAQAGSGKSQDSAGQGLSFSRQDRRAPGLKPGPFSYGKGVKGV